MKPILRLLILMALGSTLAQSAQGIPLADTQHYLWITFFSKSSETMNDSAILDNDSGLMAIEESRPKANSFKYDLWVYKLDSTGETFRVNGTLQSVNEEVRAWIAKVRELGIHRNENIFGHKGSLEWFWKLHPEKGFISVAYQHETEPLTSWYASDSLDSQPERSTDDLRVEALAFRHLLAHQLMDPFILRDAAGELFEYDKEAYTSDIGRGYLLAAKNIEDSEDRLEVWRDLQPYLR
jgi:hypothetical protein